MWILQLRKKLKSKNIKYNIRENVPPRHILLFFLNYVRHLLLLRSVSQKKGKSFILFIVDYHIYIYITYFISFPFSHFQVSLYHLHHLYLHQVIFFLLLFVFQVLFVIIPNVYLPLFAIPPFVLHSILLL